MFLIAEGQAAGGWKKTEIHIQRGDVKNGHLNAAIVYPIAAAPGSSFFETLFPLEATFATERTRHLTSMYSLCFDYFCAHT